MKKTLATSILVIAGLILLGQATPRFITKVIDNHEYLVLPADLKWTAYLDTPNNAASLPDGEWISERDSDIYFFSIKNSQVDGRFKHWNANDGLIEEGNYRYGTPDGVWDNYINGRLGSKRLISNGQEQESYLYYTNGNVKRRFIALAPSTGNSPDLLMTHFYDNGRVQSHGTTVSGREIGIWSYYHPNGSIRMTGAFQKELKQAKWEYYDENGFPVKEEEYQNGKLVSLNEWEWIEENGRKKQIMKKHEAFSKFLLDDKVLRNILIETDKRGYTDSLMKIKRFYIDPSYFSIDTTSLVLKDCEVISKKCGIQYNNSLCAKGIELLDDTYVIKFESLSHGTGYVFDIVLLKSNNEVVKSKLDFFYNE